MRRAACRATNIGSSDAADITHFKREAEASEGPGPRRDYGERVGWVQPVEAKVVEACGGYGDIRGGEHRHDRPDAERAPKVADHDYRTRNSDNKGVLRR